MRKWSAVLVLFLAAGGVNQAVAQGKGTRTVTVSAGGFTYDRGGDQTSLLGGLGVDWQLSRYLIAELAGSWSRPEVTVVNYAQNPAVTRETNSHLLTATAGVQAQLPLGRVRPYLGVATGLFVRYDVIPGDRFLQHTTMFPGGIRVDVTDRIGLRGEVRARFDEHQDGGSGINTQQTVGVSLRF